MNDDKKISLLLPATGEPLLMYCWMTNLQKYSHHFDNIFVSVDCMGRLNRMEFIFIQNYLTRLYRKFPNLRDNAEYLVAQHGLNIDLLLNKYEPDIRDNVLLMEEDDFIINPQFVTEHINDYFNNGYDVLGVGRGSATPYLLDSLFPLVKRRPNLQIDTTLSSNDTAISFWPTFFLTRKNLLTKSSREFHSKTWPSGSVIKIGDEQLVLDRECSGDTFVSYAYELYGNPDVKKVRLLSNTPQEVWVPEHAYPVGHYYRTFHSSLHDNELLDMVIPTSMDFHVGSLSTFISNKFWKPFKGTYEEHSYMKAMYAQKANENNNCNNLAIVEPYRRCLLMREMLNSIKTPKDFEFYDIYQENLNRTINTYETENDMVSILKAYGINGLHDGKIDVDKYKTISKMIL